MKRKIFSILLVPGIALLSLASVATAQSSSVKVSAPNANCKTTNLRASAPGVGVSAPNPSRLVPNVGKLLRKGVGVPAPDTEAPDVGSPSTKVSRTTVKCANVNTSSESPAYDTSTTSAEAGVQGLW
jgi:hypothetical protein